MPLKVRISFALAGRVLEPVKLIVFPSVVDPATFQKIVPGKVQKDEVPSKFRKDVVIVVEQGVDWQLQHPGPLCLKEIPHPH